MPDSQHKNGAAEVMVKMVKGVKKAFLKSMGEQVLSLNEMVTLMAEISNIVNQRPIGIKPTPTLILSICLPTVYTWGDAPIGSPLDLSNPIKSSQMIPKLRGTGSCWFRQSLTSSGRYG